MTVAEDRKAEFAVSEHDQRILRDLARKVAELAHGPRNLELKRQWYLHDQGRADRPMVLTENDAGLHLIEKEFALQCEGDWAKGQEYGMRQGLLHFEVVADDSTFEPWINVPWRVWNNGYGVEIKRTRGVDTHGGNTGYHWEAPIKDLEEEFGRLRPREFFVDREGSRRDWERAQEVYDGILPLRRRGNHFWTLGMTQTAIFLIGLEELMVYMYDCPEALHEFMAFLRDDHLGFVDFMEREGLFTLNNENDYCGSGSRGYTRALPQPDRQSDAPVRARDLWALSESQETVGISPEQFAEFIFPYQQAVAERFGKCYYGCCEPVHNRWDSLKRLNNLARVSVSPWCDEEFMSKACAESGIVYSRKPSPSLISTDHFDETRISEDLRQTATLCREAGCTLEIVMKDVHTVAGDTTRLPRWTALAREAIEKYWR